MTDRIDLDELTETEDEQADERNPGDWFWRGEGDPDDEPALPTTGGPDAGADDPLDRPMPHVPRPNKDKPVGIPVEGGGAGGGPKQDSRSGTARAAGDVDADGAAGPSPPEPTTTAASGPHGGGVDDMTLAFTYGAVTRLDEPSRAVAEASRWADWIGIVGDVEAHVINKFQRDHGVDVDFFNGSGTGPGERLGEIDEHSMFYADRMVVVGVEGEDEPIARVADWEFVPLSTAAEKAGWERSA